LTVATHPIRRRGLHQRVVDLLGQGIVRGDYEPGAALPNEADLGIDLDVSGTVVREAIKVLAAKGLVASRPKIGTRVLDRANWSLIDPDVLAWQIEVGPDARLFRELTEVRSIIEPRASALAAERRTEREASQLCALVEQLDLVADEHERYIAVDLALHGAILDAAHNELLAGMTGTISVALAASRRLTVRTPKGPRIAMQLHRTVVEAIVAHDPERASRAMASIIRGADQDIEGAFEGSTVRGNA
jgi:DNA-binding FadR family transcriptional regulator